LFLERNGEIISAEGLIGGTKEEPKAISRKGHYIQEDNIMVEYNIPPVESAEDFVLENKYVLDFLQVMASLQGNATLNFSASAEVDEKYLQTEQAKKFGCEPDYNVWERCPNDSPCSTTNLRTCGGHIHIGYNDPDMETNERIIKAMDAVLGVASVLLDPDDRRKEMYGKAGAFRFKDYGVEYRSLSNFWLRDEDSMAWVFNETAKAIDLVNSGIVDEISETFGQQIQEVINTNNKQMAQDLQQAIEELVFNQEKVTN
jgi:hypothetical protein